MYLKEKYCVVNKENNLYIANSTCNPPKRVNMSKNGPYCVSNAEEIW
jgi:hypothetical protein